MTHSVRRLGAVFALLILPACSSIPPLNFTVPNVGPSSHRIDAEVRSMTVTLARPDERTGDIAIGYEQILVPWENALQEAFDRMVIFRDDAPKKVSLAVKVLKVDSPAFGFAMTTTTAARYEIIDREDGSIIFTQEVETSGTTPLNYAFVGVARARESINRAVQNNISRFLQILETVDINKPMFPANSGAASEPKKEKTSPIS